MTDAFRAEGVVPRVEQEVQDVVTAVALGSAFLAEPFGLREAVGMLVILAGVALVQFPSKTPKPACPAEE